MSSGNLPKTMWASVIRRERYGEPKDAFVMEQVPLPAIAPDDVWIEVRAAGINYNGVWAGRGSPVDPVSLHQEDFHIAGSDAAGVVRAVGGSVTEVAVGDHVVVDGNVVDPTCPYILRDEIAMSPSTRVLGLDINFGTFAQFARVRQDMCHPKPEGMTWAQAATLVASGSSSWEMLHGWPPHNVREGDVVLVFGGAGGTGAMAIQLAAAAGALPIAVASSEERAAYCRKLGAVGVIDRRRFDHWGVLPDWRDDEAMGRWHAGVRAFGRAIFDVLGERRMPRIVIEHPGQATLPTSMYVCDRGGMVVICGGTTGYNGSFDLRHHWVRQKRLQGSHMFSRRATREVLRLVDEGKIHHCTTEVVPLHEVGMAHHRLATNTGGLGKAAVDVAAFDPSMLGSMS